MHCTYGQNGPIPCPVHATEAKAAADAAEQDYRASREHMPGRDVARMSHGVRTYAWQRALERPLSSCSDGSPGLGWPALEE